MKAVRKVGDGAVEFVVKTKEITVRPAEFFVKTLSKEKSVRKGILYYGELLVLNLAISTGILLLYKNFWREVDWAMLAGAAAVTLVVRGVYVVVGAWVLNILVRVLGGKADLRKTFQVFVYSKAPYMIFGPLLGMFGFIAQIYGYWVQAVGINKAYGISYRRIAFLYGLLLVIYFGFYYLVAMGLWKLGLYASFGG